MLFPATLAALPLLLPTLSLAPQDPGLEGGVELAFQARHDGRLGTFDSAAEIDAHGGRFYVTGAGGSDVITRAVDATSGEVLAEIHGQGSLSSSSAAEVRARLASDASALFAVHPRTIQQGLVGLGLHRFDLIAESETWDATWVSAGGASAFAPVVDVSPDGSRVFVAVRFILPSFDSSVLAFDAATGNLLWEHALGSVPTSGLDLRAGDGLVFVTRDETASGQAFNVTRALNAATGSAVWASSSRSAPAPNASADAVLFHGVVEPTGERGVLAYDESDGSLLWKAPFPIVTALRESADGARVYAAGYGSASSSLSLRTRCFDAFDGALLWQRDEARIPGSMDLSADGGLVVTTGGGTGTLRPGMQAFAYDALTGGDVWTRPIADPSLTTPHLVAFEPSTGRAAILAASTETPPSPFFAFDFRNAEVFAFEGSTGAPAWHATLDTKLSGADRPGDIAASPDGKAFYVPSGLAPKKTLDTVHVIADGLGSPFPPFINSPSWSEVTAFDAETGRELWTSRRARESYYCNTSWGADFAAPSPDGAQLFVSIRDGDELVIVALDAADGSELWSRAFQNASWPLPLTDNLLVAPDGQHLFVTFPRSGGATFLGVAAALDTDTGQVLWETDGPGQSAPPIFALSPDAATLYTVGSDALGAVTRALDAQTGAELWSAFGPALPAPDPNLLTGSEGVAAVADDGAVYVTGSKLELPATFLGWTAAYDAATGAELWTAPVDDLLGRDVALAPDGSLLVSEVLGGIGRLARLDPATGVASWSLLLDDPLADLRDLAVDPDGTTLFAVGIQSVGAPSYAVDVASGQLLWSTHFTDPESELVALGAALDATHARFLVMGSIDDENGQPSTRVLAYDVPSLVVDTHELSVSASGAIGFTLRAGKEYAGAPYVVLGTTGGTTPGVRLGGAHVPLNPSFYLSGSLMLDINPIQGGVGTLDPLGQAHASLPLIPGLLKDLVGTTMHHAYIVMLPDGAAPRVDFVSNAVALDVVP